MPDNQVGLEAIFDNEDFQRGISEYNSAIDDASNATAKSGSFMSDVWDGMASVGAVALGAIASAATAAIAAVSAFVFSTSKELLTFEKSLTEVFTLLPGLSQEAMDGMSEDLLEFTADMGVLTDKAVPALYQAISAGVPTDNVFDFLRTAQMAAVGGVTSLETAVDGISSVVNAYGADVLDATTASDQMFTAVRLGKTTFEELSKSLFNVIPTASAAGVEFGDIAAGLSAMTAQGVPTNVATTQLRQLLVELTKAGSDASDTFENLAGKSFRDFITSGGNLSEALSIMESGAQDSGKTISDLFGSVEAGNAALALTGKGTERFVANIQAMGDSTGATETAFNTMEQTGTRAIERIQAKFEAIRLNFADKFEPGVDALFLAVEDLLDNPEIEKAIDSLGTIFEQVGGYIAKFAENIVREIPKVIATIQALPQWFEDNKPLIVGVLAAIGVAVAAFAATVISSVISAAVAMAPIILAMVLIGAGVALLYTAWTENWGGIQEHLAALWAVVQPILQGLFDWLSVNVPIALEYLSNLWTTILLPAIQAVFSWIVANLIPLWISIIEWLSVNIPAAISILSAFWTTTLLPAIQAVWGWISTNLIPLFEAVSNLMSAVLSVAITALAGLWQNVLLPALQAAGNWISANLLPIFQGLSDTVTNNVMPALQPLADFLKNVLKAAFDGITAAIQTLTGWINTLTAALNNVTLPEALTPGSPTPFEIGLRGINDQLKRLASATLPAVTHEMNILGTVRDVPGANGSGSAGRVVNSSSSVNNYLFGASFNVNNSNGLLEILNGLS